MEQQKRNTSIMTSVMHVVYFNVKTLDIRGKRDNKDQDLNCEHPFLRVSGYKRRNAIKDFDVYKYIMILRIRVCHPYVFYLLRGKLNIDWEKAAFTLADGVVE